MALSPETQKLLDNVVESQDVSSLLENLQKYLEKFTGWKKLQVSFDKSVLHVTCENGPLVSYNIETGHEVYGRLRHIGLMFTDVVLIKPILLGVEKQG